MNPLEAEFFRLLQSKTLKFKDLWNLRSISRFVADYKREAIAPKEGGGGRGRRADRHDGDGPQSAELTLANNPDEPEHQSFPELPESSGSAGLTAKPSSRANPRSTELCADTRVWFQATKTWPFVRQQSKTRREYASWCSFTALETT